MSKPDVGGNYQPDYARIQQGGTTALMHLGVWVIVAFVVAAVSWAAIAKVDTTIVTLGKLETKTQRIALQSIDAGTLSQVNADVGHHVKKGEVLALLDGTVPEADLTSALFNTHSVAARIARLQAELTGEEPERFSVDATQDELERQLFRARVNEFMSMLRSLDEKVERLSGEISAKESEIDVLRKETEILEALSELHERLYTQEKDKFRRDGPRKVEFLRSRAEFLKGRRQIAEAQTSLSGLRSARSVVEADRRHYVASRQKELNADLVASVREHANLVQRQRKVELSNSLVQILSPFDGVVLKVAKKTVGSVVMPGEDLFEILPGDAELEAVIDIDPGEVGRIKVGDPVTMKLDTLPFTKHGTLQGRLRLVSEDAFQESIDGQRRLVFRGWVTIGAEDLKDQPPGFRLLPGMTLEADVKVREQRVLSYLLYPIVRGLSQGLSEP